VIGTVSVHMDNTNESPSINSAKFGSGHVFVKKVPVTRLAKSENTQFT
jgi:hypothetical protein